MDHGSEHQREAPTVPIYDQNIPSQHRPYRQNMRGLRDLVARFDTPERYRTLPWFSEGMAGHCFLGALLVALCGLLSSPNLDDPLVPEIAEKYLTDYEGYCEAARKYTIRYANTQTRPIDEELVFPTEGHSTIEPYFPPTYQPKLYNGSTAPRLSRSDSDVQLMNLYGLSESDLKSSMTALSTRASWAEEEEEESVNV